MAFFLRITAKLNDNSKFYIKSILSLQFEKINFMRMNIRLKHCVI